MKPGSLNPAPLLCWGQRNMWIVWQNVAANDYIFSDTCRHLSLVVAKCYPDITSSMLGDFIPSIDMQSIRMKPGVIFSMPIDAWQSTITLQYIHLTPMFIRLHWHLITLTVQYIKTLETSVSKYDLQASDFLINSNHLNIAMKCIY